MAAYTQSIVGLIVSIALLISAISLAWHIGVVSKIHDELESPGVLELTYLSGRDPTVAKKLVGSLSDDAQRHVKELREAGKKVEAWCSKERRASPDQTERNFALRPPQRAVVSAPRRHPPMPTDISLRPLPSSHSPRTHTPMPSIPEPSASRSSSAARSQSSTPRPHTPQSPTSKHSTLEPKTSLQAEDMARTTSVESQASDLSDVRQRPTYGGSEV